MMKALLAFTLALSTTAAQGTQGTHPDFSGRWTLDGAASDYGPFPAPQRRTDVIEHRDATLKVARTEISDAGQERSSQWTCTTDRVACTNSMRGMDTRSAIHWEGSTLVVETNTKFEGNDASVVDRWTLSADGRTLTILRQGTSAAGTVQQRFVLQKVSL